MAQSIPYCREVSVVPFDDLLRKALPQHAQFQVRDEGPAFLRVARDLYGFERIDYMALNVGLATPRASSRKRYMHCWHATDAISQSIVEATVSQDVLAMLQWPALRASEGLDLKSWGFIPALAEGHEGVVFGLRTLHGELALAAVTWSADGGRGANMRLTAVRDLRLLINYFHSHLLRINGVDTSSELIMSSRELDCLSWTAAGKTAWEASVILGISERTVRFHLNVAREKLNCATTTQAVAKAVAQQLIELRIDAA